MQDPVSISNEPDIALIFQELKEDIEYSFSEDISVINSLRDNE